jgi:Replication initiator protein A
MAAVIKFRTPKPPQSFPDARDELNLAEFPIALLTNRSAPGQTTLKFEDTIRDSSTGKLITRTLTIKAAGDDGLPTAKDEEVILGLIQLTKLANNFTHRTVQFSRYELVQLLKWPYCGKSYDRVEESLKRWIGVTYFYNKAWWDKGAESWVDESFHLLDNISLYDHDQPRRSTGQDSLPFSSFSWNKVLFDSFQAGYLKRLDLDFYLELGTSTAKRLFRFLDKRFYHGDRQEFDLFRLAFEHVGLSRHYTKAAHIRRNLAQAIEELEAKGFLEPLPDNERYVQVRRGEWKVIFIKKYKDKPAVPAPAGTTTPLQKELTDRGVTAGTAAELVADYPAEQIAGKLEVFDWMVETKKKHVSENPAGYLVASIRHDYAVPKGFLPKAERERKKQAVEQAQKKKADKQRQEEQEDARRRAERAHINAYLEGLTPQERQALEEYALANADEKMREAARPGSIAAGIGLRLLVEREVLRRHPLP